MRSVPNEPLPIPYTSNGGLPDVALHFRGGLYHLESSYSHFVFLLAMIVLVVVSVMWPATIVTPQGIDIRYVFGLMFAWGGLCGLVPYFIRNRFGIYMTIDPRKGTIRIHKIGDRPSPANIVFDAFMGFMLRPPSGPEVNMAFGDVIALQVIGDGPFQANLVYQSSDGIQRINLAQNSGKRRVKRIAESIASVGPFELAT